MDHDLGKIEDERRTDGMEDGWDQAADGEEEDPVPLNREERLAYLEGLAEGIQKAETAATGNLLTGIVEILGDLSDEVRRLRRAQHDLESDVEDLADELTAETRDIVVTCPNCGSDVAFASDLLDEEEVELICPNCGEVVYTPGEDELIQEGTPDGEGAESAYGEEGSEGDPGDGPPGAGLQEDRLDGLEGSDWRRSAEGERGGSPGDGDDPWRRASHRKRRDLDLGELGVRESREARTDPREG